MEGTVSDYEPGEEEEDHSEGDSDDGDDQHEPIKLDTQGRTLVASSGCKIGDLSHDSVRANVDDNASSPSLLAERTEKGQILGLKGLFRMGAFGGPQQRLHLSRKWRVVHLHLTTRNDPQISRNFLSTDNLHNVSPDQLLSRQLGQLPIPETLGDRRQHVLESLHQRLGLRLLREGDDAGDEDDDDQHEREVEVGQVAGGLDDVGDDAEDGAHPEHNGEPVCDLLQESYPGWRFLLLGELVVTLLCVAAHCCLGAHAVLQTSPEAVHQLLQRDLVLIHALDLPRLLLRLPLLKLLLIFWLLCICRDVPVCTFLGLGTSGLSPLDILEVLLDLSAAT